MLICDSKLIRISAIFSFLLLYVCASIENGPYLKDRFWNARFLQKLDPELKSKIDEVANNPAFAHTNFCKTNDFPSLSTIQPDDVVSPLNSRLTVDESQRFSKYFQDEYLSNSTMLNSPKFGNYTVMNFSKVKTNHISFVGNKIDDDLITIILHESDSKSSTKIKTYFVTNKENIVMNPTWIYDFEVNDEFAYCYFCNNNDLKPQVCNLHLSTKTWGARNTIEMMAQIYVPMMDSDLFTVFTAKMEGGPMTMRSTADTILLCLYLLIPIISTAMNVRHLYHTDRSKDRRLSGVGYWISCCMVNSYHLHILLSLGMLNINQSTDLVLAIFFLLFSISWIFVVTFIPILSNSDEENGELKINMLFLSLHLEFYCSIGTLVSTILGPFVLYKVYMSPLLYFLLGNIYIIPIFLSAVGRVTLNDYYLSVLLNGVYFGLFPFTKCGPGFWIEGFDLKWFTLFMLTQIIYTIIIRLQQTKGSRFFFPTRYRRNTYSEFRFDLDTDPLHESTLCNLCSNSIYDVEQDDKDINENYKYTDFGSNCYFKLQCRHIFHPRCLIQITEEKNECPTCQAELPPFRFDD